MDLEDWVREYDFESDENDRNAFCWGEGDDYDYCMDTEESESDDDEGDRKGMPQEGTGINDATILGDKKPKSEVSGTRIDTKLNFHDGDKMDLIIQDEASDLDDSEKDMSTEMKKKIEKRRSREDGVESEQNDGVEAAVQVKKKMKKTISTGDVSLKDNDHWYWVGTTAVGFVLTSCVILGSDRQKGNPSGKEKRLTKKTCQLENLPIGYVRVGVAVDADILVEELKNCVKDGSNDITKMPEYISNRASAGLAAQLLIGGYSQNLEPHFYCVSKNGILDLTADNGILELRNRFQTGSGRGAAFVTLNERYKPDLTESEGKVLMEDCLYNGIKNDRHTGKGIEYIVIKPGQKPEIISMTLEQYENERRNRAQLFNSNC